MRLVELTNTNSKAAMDLDIDRVVAWWHSKHHASTIIAFDAGLCMPVQETVQHIKQLKEGKKNVRTKTRSNNKD